MSVALIDASIDTRWMTDKTYYTISEAADLLAIHPMTVRRMIRRGEIAFVKVGSHYRISADAIAETKNEKIEREHRHDTSSLARYATREWREGTHPRQIAEREGRREPPTFILVDNNKIAQRREGTERYDIVVTVHDSHPKRRVEQLLGYMRRGLNE